MLRDEALQQCSYNNKIVTVSEEKLWENEVLTSNQKSRIAYGYPMLSAILCPRLQYIALKDRTVAMWTVQCPCGLSSAHVDHT